MSARTASLAYLGHFGLFFLCALVCAMCVFLLQIGVPTESSFWTYYMENKKVALADAYGGKRILIVAGSSALYGLRATIIESRTGIRTVNLAVHGEIGLDYMLDVVKRSARAEDIIILPLEYSFYYSDRRLDYLQADYVMSRRPGYFDSFGLREKLRYAMYLHPIDLIARFLGNLCEGCSQRIHVPDLLDDHGDFAMNRRADQNEGARLIIERLSRACEKMPIEETYREWMPMIISDRFMATMRDFIEWSKRNHVSVIATYPNFMNIPCINMTNMNRLFELIPKSYQELGVPVIGAAQDAMYPPEDFFDTEYHPFADAAERRTNEFVDRLMPVLEAMKSGVVRQDAAGQSRM